MKQSELEAKTFTEQELDSFFARASKTSSQSRLQEQQFRKHCHSSQRMHFTSLERDNVPLALACMMETPCDNCWLICQIASFHKGYGKVLLQTLCSLHKDIWLGVDWSAGPKLEDYYAKVLPAIDPSWRKVQALRTYAKQPFIQTFWLRIYSPKAEVLVIDYIE